MISGLRFSGQSTSVPNKSNSSPHPEPESALRNQRGAEQPIDNLTEDRFCPAQVATDAEAIEPAAQEQHVQSAGTLINSEDARLSRSGFRMPMHSDLQHLGTTLSIPMNYAHQHREAIRNGVRRGLLSGLPGAGNLSAENIARIEALVSDELSESASGRSALRAAINGALMGLLLSLPMGTTQPHAPGSGQSSGNDREPANASEIREAIREAMEALKAKARAEGGDEPTPEELANAGARAAQAFFNRE